MAQEIIVKCDIKGCKEKIVLNGTAGQMLDWGRREVRDSVKKDILTGVQEFKAAKVFYLCPACIRRGSELPSPETHPELVAWIEQVGKDAGDTGV